MAGSTDKIKSETPIQIDWKDGDRKVVMTPENADKFLFTVREVVEACRSSLSQEEMANDLRDRFLPWVKHGFSAFIESIQTIYFGVRDRQLTIFVVPKSPVFDFDLASKLALLDHSLNNEFDKLSCDVLQIPGDGADTLASFIAPGHAVLVYGRD